MTRRSVHVRKRVQPPLLSLVPRPYAKTEGGGPGERVTCVTSGRRVRGGGQCPMKNLEVLLVNHILSKNLTTDKYCICMEKRFTINSKLVSRSSRKATGAKTVLIG